MMFSAFSTGNVPANMAGMMAKYLATSLAIEKVVSAPRVISNCLPISTISISLVGCRSVVGTISSHGDQLAIRLLLPDQVHFILRGGLSKKVVDSCFPGNGRGGKRIVPRDHHSTYANRSQLIKTFLHAPLNDVFQLNDTERSAIPLRHYERSPAQHGNLFDDFPDFIRQVMPILSYVICDRVGRSLANFKAIQVDARHAGLGAEWDEFAFVRAQLAPAQPIFLLREHNDRATLGSFVRKRRKLGRICELLFSYARSGNKTRCLTVAERDGAGLIQQQRVYVSRSLYCPPRHREHIVLY